MASVFVQLKEELEHRNRKIRALLETYRQDIERVDRTYREEVADGMRREILELSRKAVVEAHETACKNAERLKDQLSATLGECLGKASNDDLMKRLRTVKEFGLRLTETELRAFADAMHGDVLGLRCVQTIARTSGFEMKFSTVEDLENDIKNLAQMFQRSSWAPNEFMHEALEVLPNAVYRGVDQGRPTVIGITVAQAATADALKKLDEAATRWAGVVNGDVDYTLEPISHHAAKSEKGA